MTLAVSVPLSVLAAQPQTNQPNPALLGFYGVLVGAAVSLVGSSVIPWVRDAIDRRRRTREVEKQERRDWMMTAIAALLALRQATGTGDKSARATALAEVGNAIMQLRARLKSEEEDVSSILLLMLAMIQQPAPGVGDMLGETMISLTDWARGDLRTEDLVPDVERRAGVTISTDRRSASRVDSGAE